MATFNEVREYLSANGPVQLPYATNEEVIFTAEADICRRGPNEGQAIIRITSGTQTNILIYEGDWGNARTAHGTLISHIYNSLNPYIYTAISLAARETSIDDIFQDDNTIEFEPKKIRRMYQEKSVVLHHCLRKYFLRYEHKLITKEQQKTSIFDMAFRHAAQIYMRSSKEGAFAYINGLAELSEEEMNILCSMLDAFDKEWTDGKNIIQPVQILGYEKTIHCDINFHGMDWRWYFKSNMRFMEEGHLNLGAYITLSDYGAGISSYYQANPHIFAYQHLAKDLLPTLDQTIFIVVTKSSHPRCIIERVPVASADSQIAAKMIEGTMQVATMAHANYHFPRQGTHCQSTTGACEFYPLCYVYNPFKRKPEQGISPDYIKTLLHEKYMIHNPDEHLGLISFSEE